MKLNDINKRDPLSDEEIEVKIANYLLDNSNPTDLQFHAFAAGIGVDKDRVEEIAYRMLSTVIRGAFNWDLLGREEKEMNAILYMTKVNPDQAIAELSADHKNPSPNMLEVMLRVRNKDEIDRLSVQRLRTLSYAEDEGIALEESDLAKKSDRTIVNDQTRITLVNEELTRIGLSQTEVDTVLRLLELDGYSNQANAINSAYSSLREELVRTTDYVFDDVLFGDLQSAFGRISKDRRDLGEAIRVTSAQQVARIMREITSKYGVSTRGLFSGIAAR